MPANLEERPPCLVLSGLSSSALPALPLRHPEVPDGVLHQVHVEGKADGGGLSRQDVRLVPHILPSSLAQFTARLLVHFVQPALQIVDAANLNQRFHITSVADPN